MSNPFGDAFDEREEVLEGFLCPICKEDLKSPDRLTTHFDSAHSEDDQAILKSFKDIFITAKNKIKRLDETINQPNAAAIIKTLKAPVYDQDVGTDLSHFSYFQAIRTPRLERYATETNKLIIRLHKLLTDLPSDPAQRRQHEKNIVPWLDGEAVKLCPNCVNCVKTFHITRRQHHCRLCGSIMCHDCSLFLDLDEAEEEEIRRLQQKRKQETEMRIERERRLALEAIERSEMANTSSPPIVAKKKFDKFASGMAVKQTDNWSGLQADTSISNNDPLVEQINIIKGYIKQARDELRFEENLQELQEEFYLRQRAKEAEENR